MNRSRRPACASTSASPSVPTVSPAAPASTCIRRDPDALVGLEVGPQRDAAGREVALEALDVVEDPVDEHDELGRVEPARQGRQGHRQVGHAMSIRTLRGGREGARAHPHPSLRGVGYRYLWAIPPGALRAYVLDPPGEVPISPQSPRDRMKSITKRYGYRVTMFLSTVAAFAFVVQGAKRW